MGANPWAPRAPPPRAHHDCPEPSRAPSLPVPSGAASRSSDATPTRNQLRDSDSTQSTHFKSVRSSSNHQLPELSHTSVPSRDFLVTPSKSYAFSYPPSRQPSSPALSSAASMDRGTGAALPAGSAQSARLVGHSMPPPPPPPGASHPQRALTTREPSRQLQDASQLSPWAIPPEISAVDTINAALQRFHVVRLTFPASRAHLWDRTPLGKPIRLLTTDIALQLRVRGDAMLPIRAAAESAKAPAVLHLEAQQEPRDAASALQLTLGPDDSSVPAETAAKCGAPKRTDSLVTVTRAPETWEESERETVDSLAAAFRAACTAPGPPSLTRLLPRAIHARLSAQHTPHTTANTATADIHTPPITPTPTPTHVDVTGLLLQPALAVTMTALHRARVLECALGASLAHSAASLDAAELRDGAAYRCGLLSMERTRELVPMLHSDPLAETAPLVGIWIAGVSSIRHTLVVSSALAFHVSDRLRDKAVTHDGAFLILAYFSRSARHPELFECNLTSPRGVPLMPYELVLSVPLSACTEGNAALRSCLDVTLVQRPHLLTNMYIERKHQAAAGLPRALPPADCGAVSGKSPPRDHVWQRDFVATEQNRDARASPSRTTVSGASGSGAINGANGGRGSAFPSPARVRACFASWRREYTGAQSQSGAADGSAVRGEPWASPTKAMECTPSQDDVASNGAVLSGAAYGTDTPKQLAPFACANGHAAGVPQSRAHGGDQHAEHSVLRTPSHTDKDVPPAPRTGDKACHGARTAADERPRPPLMLAPSPHKSSACGPSEPSSARATAAAPLRSGSQLSLEHIESMQQLPRSTSSNHGHASNVPEISRSSAACFESTFDGASLLRRDQHLRTAPPPRFDQAGPRAHMHSEADARGRHARTGSATSADYASQLLPSTTTDLLLSERDRVPNGAAIPAGVGPDGGHPSAKTQAAPAPSGQAADTVTVTTVTAASSVAQVPPWLSNTVRRHPGLLGLLQASAARTSAELLDLDDDEDDRVDAPGAAGNIDSVRAQDGAKVRDVAAATDRTGSCAAAHVHAQMRGSEAHGTAHHGAAADGKHHGDGAASALQQLGCTRPECSRDVEGPAHCSKIGLPVAAQQGSVRHAVGLASATFDVAAVIANGKAHHSAPDCALRRPVENGQRAVSHHAADDHDMAAARSLSAPLSEPTPASVRAAVAPLYAAVADLQGAMAQAQADIAALQARAIAGDAPALPVHESHDAKRSREALPRHTEGLDASQCEPASPSASKASALTLTRPVNGAAVHARQTEASAADASVGLTAAEAKVAASRCSRALCKGEDACVRQRADAPELTRDHSEAPRSIQRSSKAGQPEFTSRAQTATQGTPTRHAPGSATAGRQQAPAAVSPRSPLAAIDTNAGDEGDADPHEQHSTALERAAKASPLRTGARDARVSSPSGASALRHVSNAEEKALASNNKDNLATNASGTCSRSDVSELRERSRRRPLEGTRSSREERCESPVTPTRVLRRSREAEHNGANSNTCTLGALTPGPVSTAHSSPLQELLELAESVHASPEPLVSPPACGSVPSSPSTAAAAAASRNRPRSVAGARVSAAREVRDSACRGPSATTFALTDGRTSSPRGAVGMVAAVVEDLERGGAKAPTWLHSTDALQPGSPAPARREERIETAPAATPSAASCHPGSTAAERVRDGAHSPKAVGAVNLRLGEGKHDIRLRQSVQTPSSFRSIARSSDAGMPSSRLEPHSSHVTEARCSGSGDLQESESLRNGSTAAVAFDDLGAPTSTQRPFGAAQASIDGTHAALDGLARGSVHGTSPASSLASRPEAAPASAQRSDGLLHAARASMAGSVAMLRGSATSSEVLRCRQPPEDMMLAFLDDAADASDDEMQAALEAKYGITPSTLAYMSFTSSTRSRVAASVAASRDSVARGQSSRQSRGRR